MGRKVHHGSVLLCSEEGKHFRTLGTGLRITGNVQWDRSFHSFMSKSEKQRLTAQKKGNEGTVLVDIIS